MKKRLAVLPVVLALLCTTVCAMEFPDLPQEHWAYSAVEKMVYDGRANGYPEGDFRPDGLVSHWEFAKMAGGDPDIVADPDGISTRDEAADYLWRRAGSPKVVAPGMITAQSKYPDAVAWAFATGIMQGDGGVQLYLQDELTRGEAACLIVRAEQDLTVSDYIDQVNPIILKRVWDAVQTGIDYEPDEPLKNGALARIALSLASKSGSPEYALYEYPSFTGKYSKETQQVCQDLFGLENSNKTFLNTAANRKNALIMLTHYALQRSIESIKAEQGKTYPDAHSDNPNAKFALSVAATNGIVLEASENLNSNKMVTQKEVACILLQLDEICGLFRAGGDEPHTTRLNKNPNVAPSNEEEYAYILDEIPIEIYERPISVSAQKPKPVNAYRDGRIFESAICAFLRDMASHFDKSATYSWTYYPSMIVELPGNTAIFRVGLRITSNPFHLTLNQLIPGNQFTQTYSGRNFFVDVYTGTNRFGDIIIDTDRAYVVRAYERKD